MIKKVFLSLGIIFIVLTFIGALLVILGNGQYNAGYSVVPLLFAIVFTMLYRNKTK